MNRITTDQIAELIAQDKVGRVTLENLQAFLRNPGGFVAGGTRYLRLLSDQPLVIGPTDGSRVIANAAKVFKAGIGGDFKRWGVNQPAEATKETSVRPYELVSDGNFAQIFGSLATDPRRLCLTQDQIVEICQNHRGQLRTGGYGNFFLIESGGEFFVAGVLVCDDGSLYAGVARFGNAGVWRAEFQRRFFVPQLANPQAI